MNDPISRQMAIDRFENLSYDDWNQGVSTTWANAFAECAKIISELPTAEPQIIRCKDCKYGVDEYHDGDCYCKRPDRQLMWVNDWDFYCKAAKRRGTIEI